MIGSLVDILGRIAAEHESTAGHGRDRVVVVGLAGRGIQSSRTPAMHEREARRLGIGYSYILLDFDQLGLSDEAIGDVVAAARAAGFHGLNVTHPFKQAVIPVIDALSSEARAIGAVNTIVFGGKCTGHNTDSWGCAESFREKMAGVPTDTVAMFGAGGAGAAVAYALMELDVGRLIIVDSDEAKAADLASRMLAAFPGRVDASSDHSGAVSAASGVVNTTPVGMAKYPGTPFDTALLTPEKWVADIVYFPAETELLRKAAAIGCRTLPGIGMAIYQAVRAFELFTGQKADRRAMADHFEAAA
jgi:shikimate dehydrogenase